MKARLVVAGLLIPTVVALVACPVDPPGPVNKAPIIGSVQASVSQIGVGERVTLMCEATDTDGDSLTYIWSAEAGTFSAMRGITTTWTAPGVESLVHITVLVSDGQGNTATGGLNLHVARLNKPIQNLTVLPGNGRLTLRWKNPTTSNYAGVQIMRRTDVFPTAPSDGELVLVGSAADESVTDVGLTNGTTYRYRAWAFSTEGEWAAGVTAQGTPSADSTPPASPTQFTATSGDRVVHLSWTNPSDPGFRALKLVRRVDRFATFSGDGETIINLGTETTYDDPELTNGVQYYYTLFAVDEIGNESTTGAKVTAIPGVDGVPPGSVTNFAATAQNGRVDLSWTNPADADLSGVLVVRKEGSAPSSTSDGVPVFDDRGESYVDDAVTNGTTYHYGAYAYDPSGNYSAGAFAEATPDASIQPPYSFTLLNTFSSPDSHPVQAFMYDGSLLLFGGNNNRFYEMDPTTGAVGESFTIEGVEFQDYRSHSSIGDDEFSSNSYSFILDGNLLVTNDHYSFVSINPASRSTSVGFTTPISWFRTMTYDGTNLWVLGSRLERRRHFHKMTYPNGDIVVTMDLSQETQCLAFDGTNLLGFAGDDQAYVISRENASIGRIYDLPIPEVYNVSVHGDRMIVTDNTRDKIYILSFSID